MLNLPAWIRALRCRIFNHNFEAVAEVPSAVRYECVQCSEIHVQHRATQPGGGHNTGTAHDE